MDTVITYIIFGLICILILVLLYTISMRRRSVDTSVLFLWREIHGIHRKRPLIKRFYQERIFYLHLAILLLLFASLIQLNPINPITGDKDHRMIFIMDTSASMKTLEGKKRRFDLARDRALSILDDTQGREVMIITAGRSVKTFLPFTTDRKAANNALKGLEPDDTGTDIEEAILRTRSYSRETDSIYLFSDGASKGFSRIINQSPEISFISSGETKGNVGILDLRLYKDEGDDNYKNTRVLIRNFFNYTIQSTVDLLIDGRLIDAKRIEIPGGQEETITFAQLPVMQGAIEVRLNYPDPFPYDNQRYAVQYPDRPKSLLLVTRENYFLRRFLEGLGDYHLTIMDPERYEGEISPSHLPLGDRMSINFDITIHDNYIPPVELSQAAIYINPDHDMDGISLTDDYIIPEDLYILREHPVMHYTDFSDIKIQRARRIKSFEGIALLGDTSSPLIIASDQGGKKQVILTFNPDESNLPLSINFPILFANILTWFQSDDKGLPPDNIITGDPLIISLTQRFKDNRKAVIHSPDGREWEIDIKDGVLSFSHTEEAGIYKILFENGELTFAANISASESDIVPLDYNPPLPPDKRDGISLTPFLLHLKLWKLSGILAIVLLCYEKRLRKRYGYNI